MKLVVCRTLATSIINFCCLFITISFAQGQITPDSTVSTSVSKAGNVYEITGGSKAGANLFHSFVEFSVPTGNTAFFNNALDISNIISRVTGNSISIIDGLLRANGSANLILINPNGINFGSNAQLSIGGSFLASTASSLKFANGAEFSATNPQNAPLLTVSVPIGLQFGRNPAAINVQGTGHNLTITNSIFNPVTRGTNSTGLRVQPGQTLALVGGDINLNGATLTAEGGRIELGSVGEGLVSIQPTLGGWTLGYQGVSSFQDIDMRSLSLADASGVNAGSIQLQGRNLTMRDGSVILIQNQGSQAAGTINISTSESVTLQGTNANGTIRSGITNETVGLGKGGDVEISTLQLTVEGGASVAASTYGQGKGGNLNIKAPKSLQVVGVSSLNPLLSSAVATSTFGPGDSGDNTISTGRLTTSAGGTVDSTTFGTGKGGNLNINASDSIDINGVNTPSFIPSGLLASSFSSGDASVLTINTPRLTVENGGRVGAFAFASGSSGSVVINAGDFVEVKGTVPGSVNPSVIGASASFVDPSLQQIFRLPSTPTGKSGNTTINTAQLIVSDGGQVTVRNDGAGDGGTLQINARSLFVQDRGTIDVTALGKGKAGNLEIVANSIKLDNKGTLSASTTSGEGGNITLQTNSLQMRRGSQISAQAGGTGNGGNINVSGFKFTNSVVLLEGSTINANAFQGRGGKIQINTSGLFTCRECQISASSTLGFNGVVNVKTPDTQIKQEVINLPQEVVKPEQIVAQVCPANRERNKSELTLRGRGGLPPRPTEPLASEALITFEPSTTQAEYIPNSTTTIESTSTSKLPPPARGWYVNQKGTVILTAQASTNTPYTPGLTSSSCQ
ncbi:S-layer family protein [Aetokthonos hydrillicola Thurmond2011]|jgi:filamentous hemagglutinin family protein|uniref:S-layer family protein n=1 Tax=Aetokthonos hydrillicola Thurmond2011 TaxID=2712845 RepID=A0AAP5I318_9CYAN|nr:S-layer family protein [Aetokthonos hydrillicola]MBO3458608.1 S-layer family protein [Aetokthonos hydrillicola CCALA 1050]MBW4585051.1 S-layer family protein [Aetokthonos hydrillicola CCALA 1050]MDR9894188.1 S-layer family protein [Aetokthonos hydrillicola Thurmond2011]